MIVLSGTSQARESCDQTKRWSTFALRSQGENALDYNLARAIDRRQRSGDERVTRVALPTAERPATGAGLEATESFVSVSGRSEDDAPYQGELRFWRPDGSLKEIRPTGSYVQVAANGEPHSEGAGDQMAIVLFSFRGTTADMILYLGEGFRPASQI
jgi:hypothetical protein